MSFLDVGQWPLQRCERVGWKGFVFNGMRISFFCSFCFFLPSRSLKMMGWKGRRLFFFISRLETFLSCTPHTHRLYTDTLSGLSHWPMIPFLLVCRLLRCCTLNCTLQHWQLRQKMFFSQCFSSLRWGGWLWKKRTNIKRRRRRILYLLWSSNSSLVMVQEVEGMFALVYCVPMMLIMMRLCECIVKSFLHDMLAYGYSCIGRQ